METNSMLAPNESTTTSKSTSESKTKNAIKVAYVLQKKLGGFISLGRFPLANGRMGFSFSRDGVNYDGFGESFFDGNLSVVAQRIYQGWKDGTEKSHAGGKGKGVRHSTVSTTRQYED